MTLWYQRAPGALHRTVGPEAILASVDHDRFDLLSETAQELWRRLEEPQPDDELVEGLAKDYGEPVERIAPQVQALLEELTSRGWVEVIGDGDD